MLNKSYNLRCLFLVWLAFLAPALANAQDSAYLSDVGYSGTGCPLGTAGAVLSPDGTSVSVLFDDFIIDSNEPSSVRSRLAKVCQINMTLNVPYGYQARVVQIDARGYINLPSAVNARTVLSLRMTNRISRVPVNVVGRQTRVFNGPVDDLYTLSYTAETDRWSACGQPAEVTVHLAGSLSQPRSRSAEGALLTFDSVDAATETAISYMIEWQRCDNTLRLAK